MGSGSSRASEDGGRGRRSRNLGVFSSSCFCLPFSLSDQQTGERHRRSKCITCKEEVSSKQGPESYESCREVTAHQCTKTTSLINTNLDQHVEVQCPVQVNDSDYSDSQGQSLIDQASNHSCCLHSPSSFLPEGPCFRTCRTSVVSSSGNYVPSGQDGSLDSRAGILENIRVENNHCDDRSNVSIEAAVNESSPSNIPETENVEIMSNCRRYAPHVPLEGSIQFSRTLSVGRLRDRVLRRNTLSKGLFGALLLEERSLVRSNSQDFSRQTVASQDFSRQTVASMSTSTQTNEALQASHAHGSTGSRQLHVSEASMIRDTSHHDLWEHRSAFLERRRRIRSQVRALQRLGRRFENLSGHDRSCILSGQHQTGHCTCRSSSGLPNLNNETSTNTSISRIVMLAEALFEALDEIHQQSAVLSSRQSISSIGSVPAPKEVVDSIPMKVYVKSKAHLNQEVPQCYICIVEYEDGDLIRTLPCQHEFHQICVDKWLKESHRVCPMCRGNVCE